MLSDVGRVSDGQHGTGKRHHGSQPQQEAQRFPEYMSAPRFSFMHRAAGRLKGSIQCRYHAWTYGLDGRLIGAQNVLHDERFDRTAFGLVPVALEVWEGLIWLNLADDHVVIHTLYPEGPTCTRVTCDWLFDPEVMARLDFDPMDVVEIFDIMNRQDWEVCVFILVPDWQSQSFSDQIGPL